MLLSSSLLNLAYLIILTFFRRFFNRDKIILVIMFVIMSMIMFVADALKIYFQSIEEIVFLSQ